MPRIKNNFIFLSLLTLIISMVLIQIWALIFGSGLDLSRYFYWLLRVFWIYSNFRFKLDSEKTMKIALILFVMGAVLTTIGLEKIAETLFRISFTGWIIGIGQALIEYRKENA